MCVCVCVCIYLYMYIMRLAIKYKLIIFKGEMHLLVPRVFDFISLIKELLHEISLMEIMGYMYAFLNIIA